MARLAPDTTKYQREPAAPQRSFMPVSVKATIRQSDIARAVGVSQRAVSVVLGQSRSEAVRVSPDTAKRIRQAARRLGYHPHLPAQQLKGVRSGMIGVLIGAAEVFTNYRRLAIMEALARRHNYRFMIGHVREQRDLDHYANDFRARMVEGVLCLRHELTLGERGGVGHALASMPAVVYLDPPRGVRQPCHVMLDRADGIRQALDHLHQRGRERVGLLLAGAADPQAQTFPIRERLRGYRQVMAQRPGGVNEQLIWCEPALEMPEQRLPLIERALDHLIEAQRADALIAANDEIAALCLKVLKLRGRRVPQDVAVVGYDNLAIAQAVDPELTTLDSDHHQVAQLLLDMLLAQLRGDELPPAQRQVVVRPRLLVRGST